MQLNRYRLVYLKNYSSIIPFSLINSNKAPCILLLLLLVVVVMRFLDSKSHLLPEKSVDLPPASSTRRHPHPDAPVLDQ